MLLNCDFKRNIMYIDRIQNGCHQIHLRRDSENYLAI